MCLEYYKEYYQYKVVRDQIKQLSTDEIAKILKADIENGTKISKSILAELEKETVMLDYKFMKNLNFNFLEKRFKRNLPTIVLYDLAYIMNKERGLGHAAVVIGVTKDDLILNNPWLKGEWVIDKPTFEQGWELEFHSLISIDPKQPIQSLKGAT